MGITKDKPLKFTLSGTNTNGYQEQMVQLAQAQYKTNSQGALDPDIKTMGTAQWTATRAGTFEYYIAGRFLRGPIRTPISRAPTKWAAKPPPHESPESPDDREAADVSHEESNATVSATSSFI